MEPAGSAPDVAPNVPPKAAPSARGAAAVDLGTEAPPGRLVVRDLVKSYGTRPAVRGVSFEVHDGVTALLGPNGAGKSTIIRCVVGIQNWDDGQILIDGIDIQANPRAARARLGYMPERVAFPPEMRVRTYLDYAARMKGVPRHEEGEAVAKALSQIDLEHVADRLIGNLSKGYRQRVGLAQAVIGEPPLLVLDEPMAGLDPLNVWDIRDALWEYGRAHSIMLSTHILPEARVLCEQIVLIGSGKIVFKGGIVDAALTGSVTRRWRLGVAGPDAATLRSTVEGAGAEIVHVTTEGTSTSAVIDAETPAIVNALASAILQEGWSLAHLEPMTDLIDAAFREAGLHDREDGHRKDLT